MAQLSIQGTVQSVFGCKVTVQLDTGLELIIDADIWDSLYMTAKVGDVVSLRFYADDYYYEVENLSHQNRLAKLRGEI